MRELWGMAASRRRRLTALENRNTMLSVGENPRNDCFHFVTRNFPTANQCVFTLRNSARLDFKASPSCYDPRRPDFIDVAGGFPARTGGGVGACCCCGLAASGTPWGLVSFLFFEKSGISFLRFITLSVPSSAWVRELHVDNRVAVLSTCERGDSNPHGLLHWILSPARLPIPPLPRRIQHTKECSFRKRGNVPVTPQNKKAPATLAGAFPFRVEKYYRPT
jgi:hypothetical protein